MEKFAQFLGREGLVSTGGSQPVKNLRELADKHPDAFMRFRGTIARDFLSAMADYARSLKSTALITATTA